MIRELRRNEALRARALWIGLAASLGLAGIPTAASWLRWIPLVAYLAQVRQRPQVGDLDLALPLPARRLWLAHGLALLLGGFAVLASGVAYRVFLDLFVDLPGSGAELIDGALRLGAGWVIAVALLQSRRPALVRTLTVVDDLFLCGLLVVVPAIVLLLDGRWVIALLVLALILGVRIWRSLPVAFTVVPLAARSRRASGRQTGRPWAVFSGSDGGSGRPASSAGAVAPAGSGWRHHFEILRLVSGGFSAWAVAFAGGSLVAFALLMSVDSNTGFRFVFGSAFCFMFALFYPVLSLMPRLSVLDPLPVRRSVLFAGLMLPVAAGLALGYGGLMLLAGPAGTTLMFPLLLLVVGLPWLLVLALAFRTLETAKRLAGLIFLLVLVIPLAIPAPARGPFDLFLRELGRSGAGTLLAWLVTALSLFGAYALAQRAFARVELPVLLPRIRGPLPDAVEPSNRSAS